MVENTAAFPKDLTQVHFPAPLAAGLQLPIIQFREIWHSLLAFQARTHTQTHIQMWASHYILRPYLKAPPQYIFFYIFQMWYRLLPIYILPISRKPISIIGYSTKGRYKDLYFLLCGLVVPKSPRCFIQWKSFFSNFKIWQWHPGLSLQLSPWERVSQANRQTDGQTDGWTATEIERRSWELSLESIKSRTKWGTVLELNSGSGLLVYVNLQSHLSIPEMQDFKGLIIVPVKFYAKEYTSSYRNFSPLECW